MTQDTDTLLVKPDFSQVSDTVEPGQYSVRIVDSKVGQWEGKDGKPPTTFITWTLETFAEREDKNNGRCIFHRTPIEGKGAFRLQQFFKAAMGEDCGSSFDRTMLHGRELSVTVVYQKNDPQYTEIKSCKQITH